MSFCPHILSTLPTKCLSSKNETKRNERERERERLRKRERKRHTTRETMATTRGAAAAACSSPNCCLLLKSRGGKKRLDFSTSLVRDRPRDHHHHRIQSCNDVECSTSGGGGGVDDERDEKKTMEKNFENDLEASFTARHNTTKKVAFASSLVASMLALHTSFDTNGMMMDQMAANATEQQRRQMFDIAFEEESSSSQQQQQQQQQTPPAPAMRMKAAAKPEEMKPELGQGFFKDLEIFIEREPPIAVGFLFLFLINGVGGVIFTLFIRETNVGPGGEFGKVLAALRKEIIKEIFKFFGGALGRFTKEE